MKVLAFGEVLWDIYPSEKYIGGAPLNFAGHMSLQNNDCYLVSAIGEDQLAADTLNAVNHLNIKTTYITSCGKPTGNCVVTLNSNGIPSYNLKDDVAYDYIDTSRINGSEWDAIYYGTLALRGEYNKKSLAKLLCRADTAIKFCDMNIRPPFYSGEIIRFCAENADILKISDEELPSVLKEGYGKNYTSVEDSVIFLAEKNKQVKIIIITLGADGSLAFDVCNNSMYRCMAVKTEVKSTVGAGDSFSASFLSEYYKGRKIEDCLAFSSKVSSFVVSHTAAVPKYSMEQF